MFDKQKKISFAEKSAELADVEKTENDDHKAKILKAVEKIEAILVEDNLTFNDWGAISTMLFQQYGAAANSITIKELTDKKL